MIHQADGAAPERNEHGGQQVKRDALQRPDGDLLRAVAVAGGAEEEDQAGERQHKGGGGDYDQRIAPLSQQRKELRALVEVVKGEIRQRRGDRDDDAEIRRLIRVRPVVFIVVDVVLDKAVCAAVVCLVRQAGRADGVGHFGGGEDLAGVRVDDAQVGVALAAVLVEHRPRVIGAVAPVDVGHQAGEAAGLRKAEVGFEIAVALGVDPLLHAGEYADAGGCAGEQRDSQQNNGGDLCPQTVCQLWFHTFPSSR